MFKSFVKFVVFSLTLTLILSLCFVCTSVFAEDAIPISTKEDFYNIRNNLNGNYYLTCDIVFSSSDFASGGAYYNAAKYFSPIGDAKNPFKGTLDGKGHTISGIKVSVHGKVYSITVTPVNTGIATIADNEWTEDYILPTNPTTPTVSPTAGIFGFNQGVIKNVNFSDCSISAYSSNSATLYVGGITGHNNGTILNCSVKNTLNCDTRSFIGGITGYQSGGTISDCLVRGKIQSNGVVYGGVAGTVAGGSVSNCCFAATFTGTSAAPIGQAGVDVINKITNCYYVGDEDLNGVGTRIDFVNAKNPRAYENFDFTNTWYMSGTLRRPALKSVALSEGQDTTTGDLNADGKLNLLDLVLLAQYVAKWEVSVHTEVSNINFDFTASGDDVVNLDDVAYFSRHLAGWEEAVIY